jgi:hypothetical protein
MKEILIASQVIIALGILNVWLVRANKATNFRGGSARTMEEEFHTYGLSTKCMKIVKVLKLSFSALLVVGVWFPVLALVGAVGMAGLMLAAVFMHCKVRDPIYKSLPAASLLLLSLLVALGGRA